MRLSSNRVPGKVRSALRKGSTTVTTGGSSTTDASRFADTDILPYIHGTVSSIYFNDTDVGIATFDDVIGGTMPGWPGTEFDKQDDEGVTAPLSRFIGAT